MRETLIEHHRDIGSESDLNLARARRCERVKRTIEVRAKVHTLFVDGPARGETEHLIPAAVGQNRFVPSDESVETSAPGDQIVAGPQIEMIGVAEKQRRADRLQIAVRHSLHGALRADRHERGRLDLAMRRGEDAAPRAAVTVGDAEGEWGHQSMISLQSEA